MKISISLFIILLVAFGAHSQDPAIIWQNTIGGSEGDFSTVFEATNEGGYILGGYSTSNISGDKTENNSSGYDFWLVKFG